MKNRIHTIFALFFVVLTGCTVTQQSISESDIRDGIKITTGYRGCSSCSKVKTYYSPPIARISTRFSDPEVSGWINVKLSLALTNRTENFVPQYQLIAEFTNNGFFSEGTDVYIDGVKLNATGDRQGEKCFSNVGSGCSWTQAYVLDHKGVEDALKSASGINLFIGKPVLAMALSNDGYMQRPIAKRTIVGVRETIPSSALVGFIKGLQAKGVELPGG